MYLLKQDFKQHLYFYHASPAGAMSNGEIIIDANSSDKSQEYTTLYSHQCDQPRTYHYDIKPSSTA
eukprot:6181717-Pleurochrysis_carterae.AAC.2